MNEYIYYLIYKQLGEVHTPSLTTTSLMTKYVNNTIINGSKTSIQEIALNPLEHNQFNTHAQSTRNKDLVRSVQTP